MELAVSARLAAQPLAAWAQQGPLAVLVLRAASALPELLAPLALQVR